MEVTTACSIIIRESLLHHVSKFKSEKQNGVDAYTTVPRGRQQYRLAALMMLELMIMQQLFKTCVGLVFDVP
jgi:hypothetical protein